MKRTSIWRNTVKMKKYPKLEDNLSVDVLVIGGGITGVSTFYQLRKKNIEVVLVEQNRIGKGVTGNTTGKLNYLQDSIYDKIRSNHGDEKAGLYLKAQLEAIELVKSIVSESNIDCDLVETDAYLYGVTEKEVKKLENLKRFFLEQGIEVKDASSDLVESNYMISVKGTYLFHVLKFLKGLLKSVGDDNIYEGTSIKNIEKKEDFYFCYTSNDKVIRAKWVVVASHYPYFNLPYMFPIRGSLEKSYLTAFPCQLDGEVSLISYGKDVISIRSYKDYLLYLSNTHNNAVDVLDEGHYIELFKKVKKLDVNPEYVWSNIDVMSNDGLPFVGKIKDRLLIGTGYSTWGMTNGVLAGKILVDIILGVDNSYVELFNPKRFGLGMASGAVVDSVANVYGYVKGYFTDSKKVEYMIINGKEIAKYQDEKGEHLVYTKCPHMGCRLIFNEVELTWDCPCHASRFDLDGTCISGPSNRDIGVSGEIKSTYNDFD